MNTLTLKPLDGWIYNKSFTRMQYMIRIIQKLRGISEEDAWREACTVVTYMERSKQLREYSAYRLWRAQQDRELDQKLAKIHFKLGRRLDVIFTKCRNGEYKTKARPIK